MNTQRIGAVPIAMAFAFLAAAGCTSGGEDTTGPTVGDLEVSVTTAGVDVDADGYVLKLSTGTQRTVSANGAGTFKDLPEGSYEVELTGVAVNCAVGGSNPRSVRVSGGSTARTSFPVACESNVGSIEVTAATAGTDLDPDGYTIVLDGTISAIVAATSSEADGEAAAAPPVVFDDVAVGEHEIELRGMTANCSVTGSNPRSVSVSFKTATTVLFSVNCVAMVGNVEMAATTTGSDLDPDGYDVTLDGANAGHIDANGSLTLSALKAGEHEVGLTGMASNCSVVGANPRNIDVEFGGTTQVSWAVSCGAQIGDLEVTASTTGPDPDPDGYSVKVDGSLTQSVASNGTVTFANLAQGDHSVELTGVAGNCSVGGANPRTVTVTSGSLVSTTFNVTCTSLTGAVEVTTSTTGADLDPNGYSVSVDGGAPQGIGVNQTVRIENLAVGDHVLELTGLAVNCTVSGLNPRTVTVPSGGTAATTFAVSCVQLIGNLEVTASTSGLDIDPDGYTVTLDGSINQAVASNGSVSFNNLDVGSHTVELSGIAVNCTVNGNNPRSVDVSFSTTSTTTFDVTCDALTGDLTVNIVSNGVDIDPDGYKLTLDGTTETFVSSNDQVVFPDLAAGDHTLELSRLASNCGIFAGGNPRTVTVTGINDETTFDVHCWGPLRSKIAFETNRDGNFEIYVMNTDGTGKQRLTSHPGRDRQPDISRDGLRIAFMSDRDGGNNIHVMTADGVGVVNLTNGGGNNFGPAWSPDGTKLAYTRRSGGFTDVWVINADGTGKKNLSNGNSSNDEQPTWSPDGTKIAFQSDRDGNVEIYVMNADGSGQVNISNNPGLDFAPAWSPDGTKILFSADRGGANGDMFIMNADGTGQTQLTTDPAADFEGSWSPSGQRIAFTSQQDGNDEVYVASFDATGALVGLTRITVHAALDGSTSWSPE